MTTNQLAATGTEAPISGRLKSLGLRVVAWADNFADCWAAAAMYEQLSALSDAELARVESRNRMNRDSANLMVLPVNNWGGREDRFWHDSTDVVGAESRQLSRGKLTACLMVVAASFTYASSDV